MTRDFDATKYLQQRGLASEWRECGCVGPQNGEPLCPCQMRSVRIVDGRYVQTRDLGPAPSQELTRSILEGWKP